MYLSRLAQYRHSVPAMFVLLMVFAAMFYMSGGIEDHVFIASWMTAVLVGIVMSGGQGARCPAYTMIGSAITSCLYMIYLSVYSTDQVVKEKIREAVPAVLVLLLPGAIVVSVVAAGGLSFGLLARGRIERRGRYFGGGMIALLVQACAIIMCIGAGLHLPQRHLDHKPLGVEDYCQYLPSRVAEPAMVAPVDKDLPPHEKIKNIAYGRYGFRNQLDLYLPTNGGKLRPVVLWIHGGGWGTGHKDDDSMGVPKALLSMLLREGVAVASINYRLAPNDRFPAQIRDAKAAVRFLRSKASDYSIDPDRIGAMGHSAGGTLAALLGVAANEREFDEGDNLKYSSQVQAVVAISAVTELVVYGKQVNLHDRCLNYPDADYLIYTPRDLAPTAGLSLGCELKQWPATAIKASPANYPLRDCPPILLIHGFRDLVVPPHQAEYFYCKLREAGVDTTLKLVPGAGHGGPALGCVEVNSTILFFLRKHLEGQLAVP